jgi:hypothetical protein
MNGIASHARMPILKASFDRAMATTPMTMGMNSSSGVVTAK